MRIVSTATYMSASIAWTIWNEPIGLPNCSRVVACAIDSSRARSAMPMGQARRRCPHATVLPPRFPLYKAISDEVMAVLADASPVLEPVSVDEAFLEPPALAGADPAEVEEFCGVPYRHSEHKGEMCACDSGR